MNVQVDEVQMVPDGFGFHLQAGEYTWVTLVFETKHEAEAAHSHAAKAVAHAKALKIVKGTSNNSTPGGETSNQIQGTHEI